MNVYIEQVIFTNFVIDFCILTIISKFVYHKPNFKQITLSSIFGSIASLITPYCIHPIISNALKILSAIIMLQILHIHKRQLFSCCLLMLTISYVIGGAILSTFGTSTTNGYVLTKLNLIYVFVFTLIFTFISYKLVGYIKSKIITNSNICEIALIHNHTKLNIKSFIDSGNSLYANNQPVNLINFDTFNKLTNISIGQYLSNDFSSLNNPIFTTANTIAGKRKILVFTIDELHFKNKIYKNIQLGVSLNFDNNKEYKVILNSYFCLN